MLKRILVLSMMIISIPSFATDVTGGETCDTDVLNTDTGPVNLRAEFEPETINLKWYNGNNQITVPTASNSCTYDTPINLPTDPVKPGYKFKGWRVVSPFDFSTLDYTFRSTGTYNEQNKTWYASLSGGNITGIALCSNTSGTNSVPGTPNESVSNGEYCWCKIIGYTPTNENIMHEPSSNLPWVFHLIEGGHVGACVDICAQVCYFRFNDQRQEEQSRVYTFRLALFGQSGS